MEVCVRSLGRIEQSLPDDAQYHGVSFIGSPSRVLWRLLLVPADDFGLDPETFWLSVGILKPSRFPRHICGPSRYSEVRLSLAQAVQGVGSFVAPLQLVECFLPIQVSVVILCCN